MGFYNKDTYYTTIDLSTIEEYKNGIEIINNEKIIFTTQNYTQSNDDLFLIGLEAIDSPLSTEDNKDIRIEKNNIKIEDCLYKIFIDYQDGNKDTLVRPMKGNDHSWLTFEHLFRFKDDKFISSSETPFPGKIKIILYNLYGFTTLLEIPFCIKQTSMQEQGIELSILAANIDNNKKISYIFNNNNENQLILARNQNKR